MIGIEAMAVIAKLTGNTADASNYTSIARNYIAAWQDLGINKGASPPHTTLSYGADDTHGNPLPLPFTSIPLTTPQASSTISTRTPSSGSTSSRNPSTTCNPPFTQR